ncbi:MAG: hypothetical protein JWL60_2332, partial [Gemmatimonadetes bacterium]|nr:hypothetical protein [Gemmatimonadota bacterium]
MLTLPNVRALLRAIPAVALLVLAAGCAPP